MTERGESSYRSYGRSHLKVESESSRKWGTQSSLQQPEPLSAFSVNRRTKALAAALTSVKKVNRALMEQSVVEKHEFTNLPVGVRH